MENTDIKSTPFSIKFGVIASLLMVIFSAVINMLGMGGNSAMGWISFVLLLGCQYMAVKSYKEANGQYVGMGQGFGIGMMVAVISSVIQSIFTYFYLAFVDDSMIQQVFEQQMQEMEKDGLTESQMDAAASMMEVWMTPGMMAISGFFFILLVGAVMSLIVAAIQKNPRPMFDNVL